MAGERAMPEEVPSAGRDAHRKIADRAGKSDPAIQIEKEKATKGRDREKYR